MSNDFVVIRIVAAFERGLSHSRFIERENPFAPCSWEHEAWEIGAARSEVVRAIRSYRVIPESVTGTQETL